MGYFSNSCEGDWYEGEYCSKCVHQKLDDGGCAVWFAHIAKNYDECNNEDSILHLLIPREGIENKKCLMFHKETIKTKGQNFDPPLKGEVVKFKEKQ